MPFDFGLQVPDFQKTVPKIRILKAEKIGNRKNT